MKLLFTYILVFVTQIVFSQNIDSLTFDLINKYRVKNGKNVITWNNESYNVSHNQTVKILSKDSAYHSFIMNERENVLFGKNAGLVKNNDYKNFIKKYFNLLYDDVITDFDLYVTTSVVYSWYTSPLHNKNMLSNGNTGSVSVIYNNLTKKSNTVFGKEVVKGWGDYYYTVTVAGTFRIK